MYKQIFINAGLTQVQAEILDFLIKNGEFKAREIAAKIRRPRGVVYKGLEELVEMGLAERIDKAGQVSRFRPEHPARLEKVFASKEKELERQKRLFAQTLPEMVSAYNLSLNKPGVRFYEGEEGIKKVLFDTLKSKTEVYTFTDSQAVRENLKEINEEYVKKRERAGIKKKIIAPESARQYFKDYNRELTAVRFLPEDYYPFRSGMQIYDNKISYQTLTPENKIAVLIEDKNIYRLHKLFFEYIWKNLERNTD